MFYLLQKDAVTNICQAADKQLITLVEWAKRIPHFIELPLEDQVILLRAGTIIYFKFERGNGQHYYSCPTLIRPDLLSLGGSGLKKSDVFWRE